MEVEDFLKKIVEKFIEKKFPELELDDIETSTRYMNSYKVSRTYTLVFRVLSEVDKEKVTFFFENVFDTMIKPKYGEKELKENIKMKFIKNEKNINEISYDNDQYKYFKFYLDLARNLFKEVKNMVNTGLPYNEDTIIEINYRLKNIVDRVIREIKDNNIKIVQDDFEEFEKLTHKIIDGTIILKQRYDETK